MFINPLELFACLTLFVMFFNSKHDHNNANSISRLV